MRVLRVKGEGTAYPADKSIRAICPGCGAIVVLTPVGLDDINFQWKYESRKAGLRKCPDPKCSHLVFFLMKGTTVNLKDRSYIFFPASRIDFKSENIPDKVLKIFSEAVGCHANGFYTASAVMIRRTIEEICDHMGAKGKDLYQRIETLKTTTVIAQELLDGMHELRFLGRDAAQVRVMTKERLKGLLGMFVETS
jgi:hypothetical protein